MVRFFRQKKLTIEEENLLKPFGDAYMQLYYKIYEMLEKKDTNEIRLILETIKKTNKKNVWFAVYRVREFVEHHCKKLLKDRYERQKNEKKPSEQEFIKNLEKM